MEVAPILKDLEVFFKAADRMMEPGMIGDRTHYHDQKIRAENNLRQLVGAPMVARKSGR